FKLCYTLFLQQNRQIEKAKRSDWKHCGDVQFVLRRDAALMHADVQIRRAIKDWRTGRIQAPLASVCSGRAVVLSWISRSRRAHAHAVDRLARRKRACWVLAKNSLNYRLA